MGDYDSVRQAAQRILDEHERLDALIHNAGSLTHQRVDAPDGTEATVASQVVGPFLLTCLLLDRLEEAAPGRVITMSSGGMYTAALTVDGLQMTADEYNGSKQYALAKRAQVTLNEMWAQRVEPAVGRVPCDASGVGRHSGCRSIPPDVPQGRRAAAARCWRGCRHHGVARAPMTANHCPTPAGSGSIGGYDPSTGCEAPDAQTPPSVETNCGTGCATDQGPTRRPSERVLAEPARSVLVTDLVAGQPLP